MDEKQNSYKTLYFVSFIIFISALVIASWGIVFSRQATDMKQSEVNINSNPVVTVPETTPTLYPATLSLSKGTPTANSTPVSLTMSTANQKINSLQVYLNVIYTGNTPPTVEVKPNNPGLDFISLPNKTNKAAMITTSIKGFNQLLTA